MCTDKLNNIVDTFINDYKTYLATLPLITTLCNQLLDQNINCNSINYSRTIDISESINIVYNYLKELNIDIANQFYNILTMKDINNNLIVNFKKSNIDTEGRDVIKNGIIYLYYTNTFHDTFTLIHEVFHKMNECDVIKDNIEYETLSRDFFGELVSVTSEFMLGNYMLEKGIITNDDLLLRKIYRLEDSKLCAKEILFEEKLINLRLLGKDITYDNLFNLIDFDDSEYLNEILENKKLCLLVLNKILKDNKLNIHIAQRYVIAGSLYDKILNDELFLNIHKNIGDKENSFNSIYKVLQRGVNYGMY